MRWKNLTLTALLCLGATACAANPLGISDAEWSTLTPQQRQLAEQKQLDLQRASPYSPSGLAVAPSRLSRDMEEARALRVDDRRRRNRFGDTLRCQMRDIAAPFDGRWSVAQDVETEIVRGELLAVSLVEPDTEARAPLWLDYSDSGSTLRVCASVTERGDFLDCATMVAGFRDLTEGMHWSIDLPDTLAASLACAFKPGAPVLVSPEAADPQ